MNNPFPTRTEVVIEAETETVRSLKSVALRCLDRAKEIKETKKILAEQKKAVLDNDEDYSEAVAEAEELVEAVKEAQKAAKEKAEYANLEMKGKELNDEMKELSETINGHLYEYSRLTGKNEIVDADGKTLKIKHQVQVKSGQMRLF